jgi:uncharacterized protein
MASWERAMLGLAKWRTLRSIARNTRDGTATMAWCCGGLRELPEAGRSGLRSRGVLCDVSGSTCSADVREAPHRCRQRAAMPARSSPVRRAAEHYAALAIVFNRPSVDLGGFVEVIRPEAVNRTIAEGTNLFALWNHDAAKPIGRVTAGTLKLAKVASGLHVTISTPISARGYVESVRRRDVTAMSFAFRALDDTWRLVDGIPIREVLDAQISEVSAVAFPAYRSTTLGAGVDGTGRALDLARRQLQTLLTR